MLAHAEAYIDFEADETNDIKEAVFSDLKIQAKQLQRQISKYIRDSQVGEVIREGFRVSILGPPNAGKSTFMNLLAKRRVSIVSEIPGTTRDLISTSINLFGYSVILTDTAGLRSQAGDQIEQIGIDIAREEADRSHAQLFILDLQELSIDGQLLLENAMLEEQILKASDPLVVINKIDLNPTFTRYKCTLRLKGSGKLVDCLMVSFSQSTNLELLMGRLESMIRSKLDTIENKSSADSFIVTRARHRELLQETYQNLENFQRNDLLPDMAAEELRCAVQAVGRITGKTDVEDMLDVLFRDFCIGK